jgi:hypothetical protein
MFGFEGKQGEEEAKARIGSVQTVAGTGAMAEEVVVYHQLLLGLLHDGKGPWLSIICPVDTHAQSQ